MQLTSCEALRGKGYKEEVNWSPRMDKAFNSSKVALGNTSLLMHLCPTALVALTTVVWDLAVGAVCEQWVVGAWQPLAFFRRQIRDERKYCTFDKELLGLFFTTDTCDSSWGAHIGPLPSWTKSRWHMPWPRPWSHGLVGSIVSLPPYRNSPQKFSTWPVRTITLPNALSITLF